METEILLSLIAIGISILGFLFTYFGWILKLVCRIQALEVKMELFWNRVGEVMRDVIKQPTHLKMDELLDRLAAEGSCMSMDDLIDLRAMISQRQREVDRKDLLQLHFALCLARIDQLLYEKIKPGPFMHFFLKLKNCCLSQEKKS